MSHIFTRGTAFAASLLIALAGCSSSDDDSGGGGTVSLNSLSGNVRATGGAGLPGVTINAGTATAMSDANGDFFLTSVGSFPSGTAIVEFDGTTAGVADQYPVLEVLVDLTPGQTTAIMPQVITLPDLTNPASSTQTVMTDASGATAAPIAVTGPRPDLGLVAATGTVITVHGVPSVGMVNLQVTPVPMEEVPMPLPGMMVASSFVTIQPGGAAFDPPGAPLGLDVTLPNDSDFPVGMMVDIWSFDHDDGAWVNRSTETGEQGIVVDAGGGATQIEASGVITEGGWHAGAIPIDTTCSTAVIGRVIDDVTMEGIPGASVALFTGQFASTDANGEFSFPAVAAYDVAMISMNPPVCVTTDLSYEVVLPPSYGSESSGVITVPAAMIMAGGTTDLGDISLTVPDEGSLSGIVNGMGATVNEAVMISNVGGPVTSVVPNENGTFFVNGLAAGDYTASYLFAGQGASTEVPFTIVASALTSININGVMGGGSETITVHVYQQAGDVTGPLIDVQGAAVTLRGTDSGSMNGIVGTTNVDGITTFMSVTGPYDVTAQKDSFVGGTNVRFARSVIDIDPTTNTINILLPELDITVPVADATVSGTVSNPPVLGANEEFMVEVIALDNETELASQSALVDGNGDYTMMVPSGAELHGVLALIDDDGTTRQIKGTLFALDQGTLMTGETLDLDFDWDSANRVDWTTTVAFTLAGEASPTNSGSACVELRGLNSGLSFDTEMMSDSPATGFSYDLPDASAAGLAGLDLWVSSEIEISATDHLQESSELLTATPATYQFDFTTVPTTISPADSTTYTVAQLETLNVSWNANNAASGGTNGLEEFSITGFVQGQADGKGGNLIIWSFFSRQGTTSFSIPPTSLPMFEAGQFLNSDLSKVRLEGYAIDFDAFFSGDFEVNLPALFTDLSKDSSASHEVGFSVQ